MLNESNAVPTSQSLRGGSATKDDSIVIAASNYLKPFWRHWKMYPKQTHSHLFGIYNYDEAIDSEKLQKAIQKLINNNYNLRTVFTEENNELKCIIRSNISEKLGIYLIHSPSEKDLLIQNLISKTFHLEKDTLFRFFLIKDGVNQGSTLVFIVHHIILDGIQFDALMHELGEYYQNPTMGEELPPINDLIQYNHIENIRISQASSDFWIDSLKNFDSALGLPFIDKTIPLEKQITKRQAFRLSADETKALTNFSEENNISSFNLLKILWATLIARYASRSKQVIVYPTSVRTKDFHHLHGSFVNVLPFALDLNLSLAQQIALEKQLMPDYKKNRFIPTQSIIQKLDDISSGLNVRDLFQVVIAQTDLRVIPPNFYKSTNISMLTPNIGSASLLLEYQCLDDGIDYQINYLYPALTNGLVEKMGMELKHLLLSSLEKPHERLLELQFNQHHSHGGLNNGSKYKDDAEKISFSQYRGGRW